MLIIGRALSTLVPPVMGAAAFLIVEFMRQGMGPKDAGMAALKRIQSQTTDPRLLNDQGQLFLTMPNFWGARSRWRYFWTGNINRSKADSAFYRSNLREGRCPPHINTAPWPTLRFALASYGLQLEEICGYQRHFFPHLIFFPLAAAIWVITQLSGKRRRRRFHLLETNRWSILWGSRHVYIRARKVGVEATDAAD